MTGWLPPFGFRIVYIAPLSWAKRVNTKAEAVPEIYLNPSSHTCSEKKPLLKQKGCYEPI
jgi:hypothetical protein